MDRLYCGAVLLFGFTQFVLSENLSILDNFCIVKNERVNCKRFAPCIMFDAEASLRACCLEFDLGTDCEQVPLFWTEKLVFFSNTGKLVCLHI